jgi:hypothetical protein
LALGTGSKARGHAEPGFGVLRSLDKENGCGSAFELRNSGLRQQLDWFF